MIDPIKLFLTFAFLSSLYANTLRAECTQNLQPTTPIDDLRSRVNTSSEIVGEHL